MTAAFILSQHDAGVRRLLSASDRPAAQRWLDAIAEGRAFTTVGISQLTTSRRHGLQALMAEELATGSFLLKGVMPWVTAAERADVLVTGAALADGRQLLIALPADRPGLTVRPPFALAALDASRTSEVVCENVVVEEADILVGPALDVMAHASAAGTGGLETSALALGQASAALKALAAEAPKRTDLAEPLDALTDAWSQAWASLLAAARGEAGAPLPGQVRAQSNAAGPPSHPGVPDRPQRLRVPPDRARPEVGAAGALLPRLVVPRAGRTGHHPRPRRDLPGRVREGRTFRSFVPRPLAPGLHARSVAALPRNRRRACIPGLRRNGRGLLASGARPLPAAVGSRAPTRCRGSG